MTVLTTVSGRGEIGEPDGLLRCQPMVKGQHRDKRLPSDDVHREVGVEHRRPKEGPVQCAVAQPAHLPGREHLAVQVELKIR